MLPPPLLLCRRHCRAAATATALLPPLPPPCFPAARLPSCRRRIQCRHCTASAALALPMLLPHCPPLPRRCRAASAALPTLPLRIRRCRPAAAAIAVLPPPPPLCRRRCCRPVILLPRYLPPLSCRHPRHRPCHANASAVLPAVATPLPRCLRRSANAATTPPTLLQRYGQDVLPAGAVALQDWRIARRFYWPNL